MVSLPVQIANVVAVVVAEICLMNRKVVLSLRGSARRRADVRGGCLVFLRRSIKRSNVCRRKTSQPCFDITRTPTLP